MNAFNRIVMLLIALLLIALLLIALLLIALLLIALLLIALLQIVAVPEVGNFTRLASETRENIQRALEAQNVPVRDIEVTVLATAYK